MSPTRRPHRDGYHRNRLRAVVGLEEERRYYGKYPFEPEYVRPYSVWHDTSKPGKDMADRVFCAFLLVEDMPLAVQIGNRTKTLEEAIERAKAMALLKETGSA